MELHDSSEQLTSVVKFIYLQLLTYPRPLANARGSDPSRDREGAIFAEYESVFMKRCTKRPPRWNTNSRRQPSCGTAIIFSCRPISSGKISKSGTATCRPGCSGRLDPPAAAQPFSL